MLLAVANDLPEELGYVECQELLVVSEYLIYQQSGNLVLVEVAHKRIEVVVHAELILQVVPHVGYQEAVALLDESHVIGLVIGVSIDLNFDEVESDLGDVEVPHELLRLLVDPDWFHPEQNEVVCRRF